MATPKIALAAPETIPLDKLEIHEDNVRKSAESKGSIEDLAADIAARGLLQSLSVRPVLDADGKETGRYGVQAGGRRFLGLKLLVKQKKLAKNAPIPCIVKTEGFAEADSLAENTQRAALSPLDEFRAFKALADKGQGEETIAAAFRVSTLVVRQRLRLANASPAILQAYEDGNITLEQLYAYCATSDHARQEQVFETLKTYWNKDVSQIRYLLNETSVPFDDRRAQFIGLEAYSAAGGAIERDLFSEEDEGTLTEIALVERLVAEKLEREADKIRAEGWAWVEAAQDFPWNHKNGFRPIKTLLPALNEAEEAELEALINEYDELDGFAGEPAPETRARLAALKTRIAGYENKSPLFDEAQKSKAGAFVSLKEDGTLLIERGFIRPQDIETSVGEAETSTSQAEESPVARRDQSPEPAAGAQEEESDALSEKLATELSAYRSLGLRDALASDPDTALLSMLHVLALSLFYSHASDSCLQVKADRRLCPPFPGLGKFAAAKAIETRHRAWAEALPERPGELWEALLDLDNEERKALFAHCAGLCVNAVPDAYSSGPAKTRHADQLAQALKLDMNAAGWRTRADNYLFRVTKAQILAAITEAKGEKTAALLSGLKKKEMAAEAERLLEGTDWVPEPLRTPEPLDEAQPLRCRPSSRKRPEPHPAAQRRPPKSQSLSQRIA
ncbi:MAG: ParB/RepB/Spo0J family partition protein [Rhodomicrobium sp.]